MHNIYTIYIYFGVFLFLPYYSNAQHKIVGSVKDESGTIEFANVALKDMDDKIITGNITDENGEFTLSAPNGKYNLGISFIGYRDTVINIEVLGNLRVEDILLTQDVSQLAEVVVREKKKVIERKMDKLLFYVGNSSLKNGFDGVEVLKRAPSVYVDGSDNILLKNEMATIMVNGKKINLSGAELANYIRNLDSKNIKAIEIQAVASAESDANVEGGVINFILNRNDAGFSANLKSYYTQRGRNPGYTSSAGLNFGDKKWNIYGTLYYVDREDNGESQNNTIFNYVSTRYEEMAFFDERLRYFSGNIGGTFDILNKHNLGIEFYATSDDYFVKSNSTLNVYTDNQLLDSGETYSVRNSGPKNYYSGILNYSIDLDTLDGKLSFIGDYATQKLKNNFDVNSVFIQDNFANLIDRGSTNATTDILSAQLSYDKTLPFIGAISFGTKFTSTQRNNESVFESFIDNNFIVDKERSFIFDFKENIYASYITLAKKIDKNINIKIGLRVENTFLSGVDLLSQESVSQKYLNFFPSFFISKSMKKDQYLSFNYSRRIRRPGFHILNPTNTRTTPFNLYTGNPEIEPEYRNNFVITYDLNNYHSFSAYYYMIQNKIEGTFSLEGEGVTVHRYQNIGKAGTVGIEYNFSKGIKDWWYLKGGSSFYNKYFILSDRNTQRSTASLNLSNDWTLPENWFVELAASYTTSKVRGNYIEADYFTSNFMLQKTFLNNKLKLRFYIDDIFDTERTKTEGVFDPFLSDFYQKKNTRRYTFWALYAITAKKKVRNNRINSSNDAKNRL